MKRKIFAFILIPIFLVLLCSIMINVNSSLNGPQSSLINSDQSTQLSGLNYDGCRYKEIACTHPTSYFGAQ